MKRTTILAVFMAASMILGGCKSREERALVHAQQAQGYLDAGDLTNAAKSIQEAIELRDDDGNYWLLAGRIALAQKNFNGAFASYTRAWELDSANPQIVQVLAEFSLASNRLDVADRYADQLLTLTPGNPQAKSIKAGVALKRNRLEVAQEIIDPLFEQYGDNPQVIMLKARLLSQQGDKKGAIALIEPLSRKKDIGQQELSFLIDNYRAINDVTGVVKITALVAERTPDDIPTQLAYGRMLLDTRRLNDALKVFDRILVARDDSATHNDVREILLESNFGVVPLNDLVKLAPSMSVPMRALIASYAVELNKPAIAQELLRQDLGSASLQVATAYAAAEVRLGQLDAALNRLRPVFEADPAHPDALMLRSRIAIARNNLDGAQADAVLVIRDNPQLSSARALLAHIYLLKNEQELVAKTYRTAINDLPMSALIASNFTGYLVAENRMKEAVEVARDFARRRMPFERAWRLLASACDKAGMSDCVTGASAKASQIASTPTLSI